MVVSKSAVKYLKVIIDAKKLRNVGRSKYDKRLVYGIMVYLYLVSSSVKILAKEISVTYHSKGIVRHIESRNAAGSGSHGL